MLFLIVTFPLPSLAQMWYWNRSAAMPGQKNANKAYNWSSSSNGNGSRPYSTTDDDFTPDALGGQWTVVDLDASAIPPGPSTIGNPDQLTLSARGTDVNTSTNEFVAVKRMDIHGDFDVTVKVTSQTNSGANAKAGIIIANDFSNLAAGGYAYVATTPTGGAFTFGYDAVGPAGQIEGTATAGTTAFPAWLRLVRTGGTVSAYYKTGLTSAWTQIGANQAILQLTAAPASQVALFGCANNASSTMTAVFDDFQGGTDIAINPGYDLSFNGTGPNADAGALITSPLSVGGVDFTGYSGTFDFGKQFGLYATYFDNPDFSGTMVEQIDDSVNFNWGATSPVGGISPGSYSVRWEGQIESDYSETYTFYVNADDGERLWVNNALIIDDWTAATGETSGSIALTAGTPVNIRLEYFQNSGTGSVDLKWSSASVAKTVIPGRNLLASRLKSAGNVTFSGTMTIVPGGGVLDMGGNVAQTLVPKPGGAAHPSIHKTGSGTLTVATNPLNMAKCRVAAGTWNWGASSFTHTVEEIQTLGASTMNFGTNTVLSTGNVDLSGLGTLNSGTGTLGFTGTGTQMFTPKAGTVHPAITKSGSGTVTLTAGNLTCASFTQTNGTFGFGAGPLSMTSNGVAYLNGGTLDVSTNTPTLITNGWLDVTAGTVNATNGTVDANTSVIVRSGATFLCPASNPFTIRENLSVLNGATFTTNSGTITMDAVSTGQDVASFYPLHNLVFNGTGGGWIPSMNLVVNGTMTISAGTLDVSAVSGSVTAGNLTLGGGTFTATNANLDVNGDFTMTGGSFSVPTVAANFKVAGSYVQSGGTGTHSTGALRLDGSGTGNVISAGAALRRIEITGTGSWNLAAGLTVDTLEQASGTLNLAAYTLTVNAGISFSGGNLDFGSGTLNAMAATVDLDGLTSLVAGTGTLRFSRAAAQSFKPKASVTHPNLTQYGTGGTTVVANGFTTDLLTLNQGSFNLGAGLSHTANTVSDGGGGPYGSLDFGSSQLHVMGNIALGNLTALVAGSGTLYFDGGSGSQFFTPKSGGATHPHIVHTTGTEIRLFTNPLNCLSFTMSNGSLDFNGQNLTTTGNLALTGGTPTMLTGLAGRTLVVGGTTTLNGSSGASKLNLNPGSAWTLNSTGAASASFATLNYGTATNPATCSNCTEGGNNSNWSFPVTWDGGGTGNNWATADNWASKTVPTAVQSVIFNGTSVKDVILGAAATVRSITMTGAYTGNFNFNGNTLTVQEGDADFRSGGTMTAAAGTLALSGAAARLFYPFAGSGLPDIQHAGAGSLTVTGGNLSALNLTLSGAGAFNLGTGLTHTLTAVSGSGWLAFGTSSLNVSGNVDLSGMSVTASGTNTLTFTGGSAQNFTPNASVSGLKLAQNGAGGTLVQGYNFLTDSLKLVSGTFNLGTGRIHIAGTVAALGGNLDFGSSTLKVSGASVSLAGLGTLTAGSGTLEFYGASAQTFAPKSGANHPVLRQNGAGGTTLLGNTLAASLELNSGTLNLGSGLWLSAGGFSAGGGGLDFGTSTLKLSGSTVNLNGLTSLSAATGTLEFTGSGAQAFTPKTATNAPALLQSGTGTTTLGGAVTTTDVTVAAGELDLVTYGISASGNLAMTGGMLTATNGSLDVDGNLSVTGGTLKAPSANPFTVAGNVAIGAGATILHNSGSLTLDGTTTGLTLDIDNAVNTLVVNGTGGEWTATGGNFTADGALSIVDGTLNLGTGLSHLVGSVSTSGGTLDFGSSTLRVSYGSANLSGLSALVPDAGTLQFIHTGAQTLTPKSASTHPLILKTGAGDLALSAYDLTTKGFTLSAGGLNLNGRNITVNGGGSLSITNGGPTTISNLAGSTITVAGNATLSGQSGASRLNLNPGANWTLNVSGSLTANYVTLSYANASGTLGQCSNCANGGSNTNWNFTTVWDGGGADENWTTAANWGSDAVPTAAEDVSFTGLSTKNVVLDANGIVKSLTMVSAYTGTFNFGSANLSVHGSADFRSGGAIVPGTGLLTFNGTGSNTFIPKAGATFPDITQNGGGGTTTITTNALTAGNLTISSTSTFNLGSSGPHTVASVSGSGALNFATSDLNVQGNVLMSVMTVAGSGRTLHFTGTGAQTFQPNSSVTNLKYRKTGSGTTTAQSYGFTTDSLHISGGTFDLGIGGLVHNIIQGIAFSGGTLDFNASRLNIAATSVNFSSLAALNAGTGDLHFTGASTQTFTPKAATAHPSITLSSAGGGGVNLAAALQSAAALTIQAGTLGLGAGTHTVLGNIVTSGGGLDFGTATLSAQANVDLSGLVSITAASGILRFTGPGSQTFSPRAADTLPALEHPGAGALAFATNPVLCASFSQSGGALNLGGQNLTSLGNLSVSNGTPATFSGLAARTITVGGNASFGGTSGASRINLDPGAAWTLAVTGALTANLATLANATASASAGACSNCANAGANSNWIFSTAWDGGGGDANWSTAANWGGDAVPTSIENVMFNATSSNATLDAAATVKSITFTSGYTGTFDFSSNTLTVDGGGADFRSGGAINAGTGTLAFTGGGSQTFIPKSGATFPAINHNSNAGTTTVTTNPLTAGILTLGLGTFHLGTSLTHTLAGIAGAGSIDFGTSNLNATGNVDLGSQTVTATNASTLTFTGSSAQTYIPKTSEPDLRLAQNGAGGTTVTTNNFTTPSLNIIDGTFNLGTGRSHTTVALTASGGGLNFNNSTLFATASTVDLSNLGTLTAGTGTLWFNSNNFKTFIPKASHVYPSINVGQGGGGGGVTIATNNLTAAAVSVQDATLNLGTGLTHNFTSLYGGPGGVLQFSNSTLNVTVGAANLTNITTVTRGTGNLVFTAASGTQVFSPKSAQEHPSITHSGAGTLQLAVNDLTCASFTNSAGTLDLNGWNITTIAAGNFTVTNGTPTTVTGLAGRTLTVAGNASLAGASSASRLNLNPGAAWILSVTGSANAQFASVDFADASTGSPVSGSDCANGGNNTNWSFITTWDGGGADYNWSTAGNWGSDAVPTSGDDVAFNGTSVKNVVLDANAAVKSLSMVSAYTGDFGFGSANLTVTGTADFRSGGSLTAGTGVLTLAGTSAQAFHPLSGATFPDIVKSGAGTTTVTSNALAAGNLTLTAGTFHLGTGFTHSVKAVSGAGGLHFGSSNLDASGNVNLASATVTANSGNTLTFTGATAANYTPNASVTALNLAQNGAGGTTVTTNGFTASGLTLVSGTFNLGSGLTHTLTTLINAFAGGGLDFGSSTLQIQAATVNLASLGTLTAGSGTLKFTGAAAQTFTPKASATYPAITQYGAGGTTVATNNLTAGALTLNQGYFRLGTGLTHSFTSVSDGGGGPYGSLDFGSSQLHATGPVQLGNLTALTAGTGSLHFDKPSGSQIFVPRSGGTAHPAIFHAGADSLKLYTYDLTCAAFTQSAGTLDLNGRNLSVSGSGNFTVTNAGANAFGGLAGRTITVGGNASITGAGSGNRANLDPGSAWTFAVTGSLSATYASVANNAASPSAGACTHCANNGGNSNWTFVTGWDGGGADNNWTTAANWGSDAVPTVMDDVTFDATSVKNVVLDQDRSIRSLVLTSGYTGTFDFSTFRLTVTGPTADFRSGGALSAGTGTLDFGGSMAQTFHPKAGHVYPNLEVSGAVGATVSGAGIDGAGNLVISSGTFALGNGFTHLVGGVGGTGTLDFGTSELKAGGNVDLSGLTVAAAGNRLTFANTGAQNFTPKTGLTTLTYRKNGGGTTTVLANGFTTDTLLLSAGTLDLGSGLSHSVVASLDLSGGTLGFSSSTLKTQAATVDLRNLAAIVPGTGALRFERTSAQAFIPHASASLPQLVQYATGGTTTVSVNPIQSSAALTVYVGTFHLGAGFTHTVASMGGTGGSGALDFGSSTLRIATGSAYLSQVAAITAGTGTLEFTAATGTQILAPLTGFPTPAVVHSGAGTLQAGGAINCASFNQTSGILDLNGYNISTTGDFTVANGTTTSLTGLAGRTLAVGGNATLNGTSTATKLGLNPGSAWTLAATGSLIANLANLANATASGSPGTCGSCANGGANANWAFATVWDGGGADTKWTTPANWSGDVVPSASEDIVFNSTSVKNALLDSNVTANALTFATGYTGGFDFADKQLTLTSNADFRGGQTLASTTGGRLTFSISGSAQLYPKAGTTLPDVALATAGTLTVGPAAMTAGDLILASGTVSLAAGTHTVKGVSGSGTLALGSANLAILGDADLSSLAGLTASGGSLQLAGTGANTFTPKAGLTHPSLSKTGSGQVTLLANGLATPSLTLAAGTLDLGTGLTHSVTTAFAVTGGTLAFGSSTLRTAAATLDMGALAGLTPGTGTLELNNASAQAFTPAALPYPSILRTGTGTTTVSTNHLTAASLQLDSGTLALGTRTLTVNGQALVYAATLDAQNGSLVVNGSLSVQNGTLECPATGLFQVTGALTYSGASAWNHRNGTLTLAGTAAGGNVSLAAPLHHLVLNGAGSTWTLTANLAVNGNLTVTAGTLDANANARDITVGYDMLVNGGAVNAAAGRMFLNGAFTLSSGSLSRPNAAGVFSVAKAFSWTGGTMALNGGKLTLAPATLGESLGAIGDIGDVELNSMGGLGVTSPITAGNVVFTQGAMHLGAGYTHTFASLSSTGGSVTFGSSALHIATGNADFSGMSAVTASSGSLWLDAATGTQILTPKAAATLPAITKTGAATLRLGASVTTQGVTVSAGSLDFNGFDLTTVAPGHFAVSNGTAATFAGLAGRTLTIAGDATLAGQAANHLDLNPNAAWTLAVNGTLTGSYADVRNSNASVSAGTCSDCANQGTNANWIFTIAWDGGGADNNWTTAANWGSDAVPAATDYVTFGAASSKNATLDADAPIGSIAFTTAYTGTFDFGIRALTVNGDADFRSGGGFANTSGKIVFSGASAHTLIAKSGAPLPLIEQNGAGTTTVSGLVPLSASGLVIADGQLNLASGTHSVGTVAAAAPSAGSLAFGSATLQASGNVDLSGMGVTPGTGFLEFNGGAAQTFKPKAGGATPGLRQSGTGGTTVITNGFNAPSLAMSAGSFNLGAGLFDTVTTSFAFTGGTLDFGSALLFARPAAIDFSGLAGIVPGTGTLDLNGSVPQTFTPKAGATHPAIKQFGAGGTTFSGVTTLTLAGNLGVATGSLTLNGTVVATGFASFGGSLNFAAATLRVTGNADFSALTGITPGTGTLQMANGGAANLIPKAAASLPGVAQTGAGTTTVLTNPLLLAGTLYVQAGTLALGTGMSHQTQGLTVGGGTLNFGSSTLKASGNVDFSTAAGLAAGTGLLELNGGSAQTFTPKSSLQFPAVLQSGAGGTTLTGDSLRAPQLSIAAGTLNLGTGLAHSVETLSATGGGLDFGTSTLNLSGAGADFSGLATLTATAGKLVFTAATGTQTLTPRTGAIHPRIEHTGAGTLALSAYDLICRSLLNQAGTLDFNGRNATVTAGGVLDLAGAAGALANLGGRTLTVDGNAMLRGQPANRLNLAPASAWTLAVTGTLRAVNADIGNSQAASAAGIADSSVNLGGNANWTFLDTIKPANVTGFLARRVGNHAVELAWTPSASSDADSVMLRYRTDGSYPASRTDGTLWRSVPKARAVDTATGLPDKALYRFAAFVKDSSGNYSLKAASDEDTAWLPDVTAPANVGGFTALVLGPTSTAVSWTASDSSDVDSVMVRYRTDGAYPTANTDGALYKVFGTARLSDTATGLTGNVLYHFAAFTRDSTGNWCPPAASARDTALYQAPVLGTVAIGDNQGRTRDSDPALAFTYSGADSMRFSLSADTAAAAWKSLRASDSLDLSAGADGKRMVAAQFKNIYGRQSAWQADTTLLDRQAPVMTLNVNAAHSWRNWNDALSGKAFDSTVGTDSVYVIRRRVSDGAYFNGAGWSTVADTARFRADSVFSVPMPNSAMATGDYDFTAFAKDKLGIVSPPLVKRVAYTENRAPETAASTVPDSALQNQAVSWTLELGDQDAGDSVLTVSATVPGWIAMAETADTAKGPHQARRVYTFTGKPGQADLSAASTLTIQARDLGGKTFIYSKTLRMIDVNDPPVFAAGQDSLKAKEDSVSRIAPKFADLDPKDKHSLALLAGPAYAAIEDTNIVLRPGSRDVGTALVRVTVGDGKLLDTLDLAVTVANVNDAPVAFPSARWQSPAVWKEDVVDSFTVVVVDMDRQDPITLATVLPPFLSYTTGIDSSGYNRYFRFAAAPAQKDTGSYSLKLRFQDAGGASSELPLSAKVAAVNDTPTAVVAGRRTQGGAARITLGVQDQDGTTAATRFHYRLVGAKGDTVRSGISAGALLALHPLADGAYTLAIKAEDEGGLKQNAFTLTTLDISGATTLSLDSARWNMIAYPGRALPAGGLGAGAALTSWDESAGDGSPLGRYAAGKASDSLVRGKGYWVKAANRVALSAPMAELLEKPFALKLTRGKQGWNQIGNPYPYSVDLSASGLVFWEWDAERRDLVNAKGILKPWGAYWVQVARDTLITIKDEPWFVPEGAQGALAKTGAVVPGFRHARDWSLQLALAAGPYRDASNFLGVRSGSPSGAGADAAQREPDRLSEAPKFGDYVALRFEHPGSEAQPSDSLTHGLAADFRAQLGPDEEWWDFSIRNSETGLGQAQLSLPGLEALEAQGLHVFLVDRGEALELDAGAPATLAMSAAASHYSLVVTPHADFAARLKGQFSLSQNYPNPVRMQTTFRFFLPQTWDRNGKRMAKAYRLRLNVYDYRGRLAAQVAEGSFLPGSHSLIWQPKALGGGSLAKGAYVYRLETPGFTKSLKLLLK